MKKQGGFSNLARKRQIWKRVAALTLTLLLFLSVSTGLSPSAGAAASFYDDFEEGSLNWNLGDGWKHSLFDGNAVLEGAGHHWAELKAGNWCNYSFSSMIRIFSGFIHLNFRKFDNDFGLNRYFIGVSDSILYLNKQIGDKFFNCADTQINLDKDWHEVDVRAYEGLLNVLIDGKLLLTYHDKDFIACGSVAYETLDFSYFLVDEVKITTIGEGDVHAQPGTSKPSVTKKPTAPPTAKPAPVTPKPVPGGSVMLDPPLKPDTAGQDLVTVDPKDVKLITPSPTIKMVEIIPGIFGP